MRTVLKIFGILTIGLCLFSCNKNDLKIIDGTYTGTFTVTINSDTKSASTTLELKNGKYNCSGNSDRFPAGGSGTYSIDHGRITFNDENGWTADFNWNLILHGEYNYSIDGKKLIISADKGNVGYYEYNLEKN